MTSAKSEKAEKPRTWFFWYVWIIVGHTLLMALWLGYAFFPMLIYGLSNLIVWFLPAWAIVSIVKYIRRKLSPSAITTTTT